MTTPTLPPTEAGPPTPIQDVIHGAAVLDSHTDTPVTDSEPFPVPEPVAIQRSPLTAPPRPVPEKVTILGGIAPEVALYKAPPPAKKPSSKPAPVAAPVTETVEVEPGSTILGGQMSAPMVPLPQDTQTVEVETPFAVSNAVREFAKSNGVDLGDVVPSGKSGRIQRKDVEKVIAARAAENGPVIPPVQPPMTPLAASDDLFAECDETETETASTTTQGAVGSDYEPTETARGSNGPGAPELTIVRDREPEPDTVKDEAPEPAVAVETAPATPNSRPAKDPARAAAPAAKEPVKAPPAPATVPATIEFLARIERDGDRTFGGSSDDFVDLARKAFPHFRIHNVTVRFNHDGLYLIVTADSLAVVTL